MAAEKREREEPLPYGKRMMLGAIFEQHRQTIDKLAKDVERGNSVALAACAELSRTKDRVRTVMRYGELETPEDRNARANEWYGEGRPQMSDAIVVNIVTKDFSKWKRHEKTGFLCREILAPPLNDTYCYAHGMEIHFRLVCMRIGQEVLPHAPDIAFNMHYQDAEVIDGNDEYTLTYFRMVEPVDLTMTYSTEIGNEIQRVLSSIARDDYTSWTMHCEYPAHFRYCIEVPLHPGDVASTEMMKLTMKMQQQARIRNSDVVVHVIPPFDDDTRPGLALKLEFMLFV